MPVFVVRFSREAEFEILVEADSVEDILKAMPKALEEINRGEWATGEEDEWTGTTFPPRLIRGKEPDHGIKDGTIVTIEDIRPRSKA